MLLENVQSVIVRLPSPVAAKPPPSSVASLLLLLKVTWVSVRLSPVLPMPSMPPPPKPQSVPEVQVPRAMVRFERATGTLPL